MAASPSATRAGPSCLLGLTARLYSVVGIADFRGARGSNAGDQVSRALGTGANSGVSRFHDDADSGNDGGFVFGAEREPRGRTALEWCGLRTLVQGHILET